MIQLRFSTWLGRRNSVALTRPYLAVGLFASVAMFLMELAKEASANGLMLIRVLAWIFLYVLSLAVATANIGVGLFFGREVSRQKSRTSG